MWRNTARAGVLTAAEAGRIPDLLLKAGIALRLRSKVATERRGGPAAVAARKRAMLEARAAGPITTHVADANRQHYEVPSEFFLRILGPRLRYSCCYWPDGVDDLASAEEAALAQTVERARIIDGDRVLELGAGWGSLSLYLAERFPHSEVVTVSNSRTQKAHIDAQAAERGLTNLTVRTADIGAFQPEGRFDRVVSIEMFEHVRNHRELLRRISDWLLPDGTCFVHVFSHHTVAWHFDAAEANDWMARAFFAGGTMPSDDLLLHEQRDLAVVDHWHLNGTHYARTLQAWLDRLDADRSGCLAALAAGDDPTDPELQLSRWRLFLLASIGTWAMRGGNEFGVSHYLFANHR
ncbi:MAG: class I SAM-dependent methyltransferase [Actinomycetota bacterium]